MDHIIFYTFQHPTSATALAKLAKFMNCDEIFVPMIAFSVESLAHQHKCIRHHAT